MHLIGAGEGILSSHGIILVRGPFSLVDNGAPGGLGALITETTFTWKVVVDVLEETKDATFCLNKV